MDFSLKKSFKSPGSTKHMRKISAGAEDSSHEELPILLDHQSQPMSPVVSSGRREVIVKIDEGDSSCSSIREGDPAQHHGGRIRRESSIDFWTEDEHNVVGGGGGSSSSEGFQFVQSEKQQTVEEDPPSKLIGQFLHKQRASSGGLSLDMDMEMDELRK